MSQNIVQLTALLYALATVIIGIVAFCAVTMPLKTVNQMEPVAKVLKRIIGHLFHF